MLFSRHCACHEGCHGSRGQDRRSQAAAAGARTEAWPTARDPGWRRTAGDRDRFHSDAAEEAGQGAGGGTGSQAASAHGRASPRHAGARTAVRAADSSLVVAAFASWHEKHDAARRVLDGALRLVEHCALETYSVLTRLPAPHRAPGDVVRDFLAARFRRPFLRLSARAYWEFLLHLPDHGISGGASYDALVAATVASHDAELVTCDRRAAPVYERYRIRVHLL